MNNQEPDAAFLIGTLSGPLLRQFMVSAVVLFAQLGADFEIAMENRVSQRLVQGYGRAHQLGRVPAVKLRHLILKEFEKRRNEVWIVAEFKTRFADDQRLQATPSLAARRRRPERTRENAMKILGQPCLGNIIGRSHTECLHCHVLAAMTGHDDHGNLRMLIANRSDQVQAVHSFHLEIGQDH